jgi:hypothetical protein
MLIFGSIGFFAALFGLLVAFAAVGRASSPPALASTNFLVRVFDNDNQDFSFRGVAYGGSQSSAAINNTIVWQGPKRATYAQAQQDIADYKQEYPDTDANFTVARKGEPAFEDWE